MYNGQVKMLNCKIKILNNFIYVYKLISCRLRDTK